MIGGLRRLAPSLLAVLAVAIPGCGSGSHKAASPASSPPAQTQSAVTPGGCRQTAVPQPRSPGHEKKPSAPLSRSRKWTLTFTTNCGSFTVRLNLKTAPNAAASMVALAKAGYFDNTLFHRIAPGFVIQGGDPSASGDGGPGYTTVDRPSSSTTYTQGVAAMAKTQSEKPGTGGSQFFVVTGPDAAMAPDYAVLGSVTKGLDVVEHIGRLGDPNTEQPTEPVVIEAVRVGKG
jgi:cyclophilin family peptidyl-prolyl cis-trans isomerase